MPYPQYYPNYLLPQSYQAQQPTQNYQNSQTIQNGGFISVRSEDEARNYPVLPGTSVTFIDESRQRVYAKTMGFSQLDMPIFVKYKLVREDEPQGGKTAEEGAESPKTVDLSIYALKTDLEAIREQIQSLEKGMDELKAQEPKKTAPKKMDSEE